MATKKEGVLTGADMLWLRNMVRFEIREMLKEHDQQRLDDLLTDISKPMDETEEMAAVLAVMEPKEWEALVQRVKERKMDN